MIFIILCWIVVFIVGLGIEALPSGNMLKKID
jgi:hypothetical protein